MRSKVCWPKRPKHANGRTTSTSMSSSKYHLFEKSLCSPRQPRLDRGAAPGFCTQMR
jgi:hypothetical protein